MATSGSTDFSNNAKELVTDAHYIIGAVQYGRDLSNRELTLGMRILNRMVKGWQTNHIHLWRYAEGSFSTVADTQSYTMGSGGDFTTRPLKITSMRHVADSIDTPMFPLTREEYFDLPNKAATGKPVNYYYDPQGGATSTGTLYVWPTDSSANTLKFTYMRQFDDFDAATDDPDLPQEWEDCLVHNLALHLCPFYGKSPKEIASRDGDLAVTAREMLEECKGFSREDPGSIYIGLDTQYM